MQRTTHRRWTLPLLLLLGSFATGSRPSHAQALIPREPEANPTYVLGAGDQISLHVTDMEELSDKPIRIDPNGFVDLPLIGRLEAGGLTIEQFKTALAAKLSRYINSPQIAVNLTDNQSRPVSVIGAVNSPGIHQLQGPKRLIDIISLAGGVRSDAGSKVIVTRQLQWGKLPLPDAQTDASQGFSTASLSLDGLLASKSPVQNILIEPNDVISIPKAEIVYVVGTVKKSGGFPLSSHESVSLIQALALAEGLDRDAAPTKARIIRPAPNGDGKVTEIPVDLKKILDNKAPDVQLFANDVLFVPNSLAKSTGRRTAEAILTAATGIVIYGR